MKQTPAQLESHRKYLKSLDEFKIRVPKGDKRIFIEQAQKRQCKSLNKYVIDLLRRDGHELRQIEKEHGENADFRF